jgi:hypothetical protein
MRFIASWWERIPVRSAAPAALVVLLGVGLNGSAVLGGVIRHFVGPVGSIWG